MFRLMQKILYLKYCRNTEHIAIFYLPHLFKFFSTFSPLHALHEWNLKLLNQYLKKKKDFDPYFSPNGQQNISRYCPFKNKNPLLKKTVNTTLHSVSFYRGRLHSWASALVQTVLQQRQGGRFFRRRKKIDRRYRWHSPKTQRWRSELRRRRN
jgi:hypothetical protein